MDKFETKVDAELRAGGYDSIELKVGVTEDKRPLKAAQHEVLLRGYLGLLTVILDEPTERVVLAPGTELVVAGGRPYSVATSGAGSYFEAARQADIDAWQAEHS